MRITKGQNKGAVVVLARDSPWTARSADGRDIYDEQRRVRAAAEFFCRRHGLRSYEIVAAMRHGGFVVDHCLVE